MTLSVNVLQDTPGSTRTWARGAALPAVRALPLTELRPSMAPVLTVIVQEERRRCRIIYGERATASASLPLDGDDLSPTARLLDAGVRL